jgi:signal transduction histidine kinase
MLVVGVVMCIIGTGAYFFAQTSLIVALDARLSSHAEKVETELEEYLNDARLDSLSWHIRQREDIGNLQTEGLHDVRMWVWDSLGTNIISTTIPTQQSLPQPSTALFTKFGHDTLCTMTIQSRSYRLVQQTYHFQQNGTYTIIVAAGLQETEAELFRFRGVLIVIVLSVTLITGLAAYSAVRRALQPIMTMTNAAARMSVGNLRERLQLPETKDEVHTLGETLNSMLSRLQTSFEAQQHFIADAAHELRTPLTALRCELELVSESVSNDNISNDSESSPPNISSKISNALEEITRLERLTDHLLTLARLDAALPLRFESVRLDELLIECVQSITPIAAAKSVTIDFFIDEALEISADILYIRRALGNLAENAILYAPEQTSISVSLYRATKSLMGSPLTESRHDAETTTIVFTNAGEIADGERERIFERFYRGERERTTANGSGLGLAIAQEIITRHGGTITIGTQNATVVCTVLLPLPNLPA